MLTVIVPSDTEYPRYVRYRTWLRHEHRSAVVNV
jgi:hypothetical protein